MTRLGDVLVDVKPGFATGDNLDEGVFQFRMHNFTRESALDLTKRRRVRATTRQLELQSVAPGDVLFNATNSPELVGKSALIGRLDESAVFSNHFMRLRTDLARLDPGYLAHFLRFQFHRGVFRAMAKAWVNQATIGRDRLESLEIPLPPVDEQRRIAMILDQADALRAKRREALAHLDDLTQSVFQDMFGDPIANRLDYEIRELADWIVPGRPITYGILKPGPHVPAGVPYVRVADMKDRGIATHAVRCTTQAIAASYRRSELRPGDLLMSIRGHVGRFAFVPAELDGANITQDSARLAVSDPDCAQYVRAALEAPGLQHWMARRTKGAAVKGINLGDLRALPLPSPPLEQVRSFARAARRAERQRELLKATVASDDALFDSLQASAFRGGQ